MEINFLARSELAIDDSYVDHTIKALQRSGNTSRPHSRIGNRVIELLRAGHEEEARRTLMEHYKEYFASE